MTEPQARTAAQEAVAGRVEAAQTEAASPSLTRGFLFADLRGYTRFVETQGATAAAELLVRYRDIVRGAVARYRGAEIKTEGDGFFVVFPAVSAAVQCGLAITQGAKEAVEPGTHGINVGVGIHAGETVDTPDGFVGSAVNIAARICAIAGPGQVLVSDTVRALTQSILPVSFTPLGRRPLKGVKEPLMLYIAAPADPVTAARAASRERTVQVGRWVALAVVIAVIAAGAYWWQNRPAAALPPGPWTIGLLVPLAADQLFRGQPQLNGVKLAIDEANASGGVGGSQIVLDARDEGSFGKTDAASAAATALAADPRVIAVVGPNGSGHAKVVIPVTNRAGLFECSPSNSDPILTKPRFGALDLRSAFPERINYVRLATSDDIQGPAAASYAFNDFLASNALVIDDTGDGRQVADSFGTAFTALAQTRSVTPVVRRALNPGTTDFSGVLGPLNVVTGLNAPIKVVFFGGFTEDGAAELRQAMRGTLHPDTPLLSWDGLWDGSGSDEGSFIQRAGADAANSYVTRLSIAPVRADFDQRYRAAFGQAPDQYSGAAYACTQVIFEALRKVAATGPDTAHLREAVRAYAVDSKHRYDTVLGSVGFDANGDSIQQFVTFYRVDMGANGGKGDWITVKQQDFGPAT